MYGTPGTSGACCGRGLYVAHSETYFARVQAEGCCGVDAAGSGAGISRADESIGAGESGGGGFLAEDEGGSDMKTIHHRGHRGNILGGPSYVSLDTEIPTSGRSGQKWGTHLLS